jgi:hypothetical protein
VRKAHPLGGEKTGGAAGTAEELRSPPGPGIVILKYQGRSSPTSGR